LAAVIITVAASSMAHAQATRTWVSGVGDDANPCSRTAPCKTFASAISKTADGGEIDVIDPSPAGTFTANKSITVDGGASFAGILAAGVNGVTVNDNGANTAVVTLRNLAINGAGSGLFGVRVISGKSVTIENCQIFKFRGTSGNIPGRAISDERTAAGSKLTVINTTMNDNLGNGVVILGNGSPSGVSAVFDNVRVFDNSASGAFFGGGAKVAIKNSFITGNSSSGVQSSDANTEVNIVDTVIAHNATGIFAGGGASVTRITRCTISENGTGVNINGGTLESYGDNNIRGNNAGNVGGTAVGQL
jgi:Right handed beta helix region